MLFWWRWFSGSTYSTDNSTFNIHQSIWFTVVQPLYWWKLNDLHGLVNVQNAEYQIYSAFCISFHVLGCGATRNRNISTSDCVSLLFRNSVRVISSYCSTNNLRCFVQGCVKVSKSKGNELL